MVVDIVPEINERAVNALVQFDHAHEPSDGQLIRLHFARRGQTDGCVKRYWAVELDTVRSGDR